MNKFRLGRFRPQNTNAHAAAHAKSHERRLAKPRARRRWFSHAAPVIAAALFVGTLYAFLPPSATGAKKGRVFTEGLQVRIDRSSPAFAALEDTLLEENFTRLEVSASNEPTVVQVLEAGVESVQPIVEKITRDNIREANLMAQARVAKEVAANMLGTALFGGLKSIENAPQVAPQVKVAESSETKPDVELAPGEVLISPDPSKAIGGRSFAATRQAAPSADEVFEHPTQTISLSDLQMSREELFQALLLPMAAADENPEGIRHVIAALGGPSPSARMISRGGPHLGGLAPPKPRTQDDGEVSQQSLVPDEKSMARDEMEVRHQVTIAGALEFADGLALTSGNDQVFVFREADGEILEKGAVWLRDGRYEIFVEETVGSLIAELRASNGEVLGRGEFELDDLPEFPKSKYRVDRIALKMRPIPQGIVGRILTAATREKAQAPIAGAQVTFHELSLAAVSLKDGKFEEPNLANGSQVILKAQRENHWPTNTFASAGITGLDLPLLSDAAIKALIAHDKVYGRSVPDDGGVIWGRVLRGGQPTAGAQIELMTTEQEAKPIYFNDKLLPDASLNATSSNGLYAFVRVPPGSHAVQAQFGSMMTEPVLFMAGSRTVSLVDVEATMNRKARLKVFDAFRTDWPLSAELSQPGSERRVVVQKNGEALMSFAAGPQPMTVDADAGAAYVKVRLSMKRDRRSIYVPMIQTKWLDHIRGSLRLNAEPRTGVIVGFIQGATPFRVTMDLENRSYTGARVLYFNRRGEISSYDHGEPGGGFVILNAPEGFRTIAIQSSGSQKVFATTMMVESKVTNVLSQSLR